jgi:hypothetical protein
MSEVRSRRLAATYEIQVRKGGQWQVANALDDRETAILEAVALANAHDGQMAVRVLGEINDMLAKSVRPTVIWSHKAPLQLPAATAFEQRRDIRLAARKDTGRKRSWIGLGGLLLLALLALCFYVGTHIRMDNVRY